ncbi:MAG: prepilin-type N-terminal cleavage/methylation domain-containing protein [Bdellovibrionaceae bacterium]|nr:prepilin-type N-terminal cleavage/methylation domain-containing protein [Pseudobdellovibrionaceae bacterium]NUM57277.1 prepilin-type N-terminal cleavage/methylation domain-containing protein [Pseudobdellovibrionaceae bacterium]
MKKIKGFTLIEVLISIAIMSTLGLLAAQAIRQAISQKKIIQEMVNETSRLRDAMKILERDINLAYHHRDWEKEVIDLAKKNKKSTSSTTQMQQITQYDSSGLPVTSLEEATIVEAKRQDPVTQFIGKENEVHFVTKNTGRIVKDQAQADFVEVGYALKDCRSADGKTESKCLYRRTSPWVDKDVTKGGTEVLLMENITEFNLRYMGKGKQDWVKDWRSDQGGDGATKDNFPWSVEVSVTAQKKVDKTEGKKYSMQLIIPIHFPNNKEDFGAIESPTTSNTTTQPTPTATPTPGGGGTGN